MSIVLNKSAFVGTTAASISLSQMFTVTAATSNPAYLVLTLLDRNEYTKGSTGVTGSLSGNGHTVALGGIGSDGRGAGIVFTWQVSSGRYYNTTYGYSDQVTYNASGSLNDVTNLSLFGTSNFSQASAYAANAYSMMQYDASGYLGSVTVVTQPKFTGSVPAQATPASIAGAAAGFVGQAWNMNGCWVLASAIAADAGASLPVQSTAIGIPGQVNGEWIVAFNGPAGQSGSWQTMVRAGEVVVIGTPGGGGHITTCVSGVGSMALLVDNITYVNSSGQVTNLANDGSSADIIVAAPHAASQEWAGVAASSVVIYQLDTPIVSDTITSGTIAPGGSLALGQLFSASDPANKTITQWQVYDTAASVSLMVNGIATNNHSAAAALSTASLNSVSLLAGSVATTDTVQVRAFNGTYWGDWTSLSMAITGTTASAPVVATQTPNQTWTGGKAISLALPANTFTDPQGQKLTYTASLASGLALPTWLSFNATAASFSGTAPTTAQSLSIKVTATDTSGLAVSEGFSANVQAAASVPVAPKPGITVSVPTLAQTWIDGKAVTLTLPANTFTDALGLKMTFAAYQVSGPNVTSWLRFNSITDAFSGSVPATATGTIGLEVIATDAQNMSAAEFFNVTFTSGSAHAVEVATGTMLGPDTLACSVPMLAMAGFHS